MPRQSTTPEVISIVPEVPDAVQSTPPPASPAAGSSFRLDPNSPLAASSTAPSLPNVPQSLPPVESAIFEACFLSKSSPLIGQLREKVPDFQSLVREVRCQSCLDLGVPCTIKSSAQTCDNCHKKKVGCELPSLLRHLAFASTGEFSLEHAVHLASLNHSHRNYMPLAAPLRQRVVSYQLARTNALDAAMSLGHELDVLEQANTAVDVQRFADVQAEERRRAESQRSLRMIPSPPPLPSSSTPSRKRKRRQVEAPEVPLTESPRSPLRFRLPPLPKPSSEVLPFGEGADHPSRLEQKRRRREKRLSRKLLQPEYSMPDPEDVRSGNILASTSGTSPQAPAVISSPHTVFVGDCPDVKELTNVSETLSRLIVLQR
jgi:hypothetical protein